MITVYVTVCEIDQLGRVRHHFARESDDAPLVCVMCGAWSLIGNRAQQLAQAAS